RMDRVAPDVLFCLFAGVPARVEVDEPSEGLHFGVEDNNLITLRWLDNNIEPVGTPIYQNGKPVTITPSFRPDAQGQDTNVLNVGETQTRIQNTLESLGALAPSEQVGGAGF